ncbi:MAG: hypothetical protein N3A69_14300, partial [Leptospiraceae bacterium]|nr:hypothetical protein [Leptospiraceae bacterium]
MEKRRQVLKPEILPYKENPNFQKLDAEITKPIPNFKQIEAALYEVPPILVASAILDDVGFTYLLDYYLRYMQKNTVQKVLQNPMFYPEALMELFYCQVTAYHKAILHKKSPPDLISSYWMYLSKAEYAILFKHLIIQTKDTEATKILLRKLDLVHLKMMSSSGSVPSEKILDFFKRLGPEIQKIAAQDMQIYDFVFDLATSNSDEEYLSFLEEYTTIFVQLRVASYFFEELEREVELRGRPLAYLEI